jgi:hypothetical protein
VAGAGSAEAVGLGVAEVAGGGRDPHDDLLGGRGDVTVGGVPCDAGPAQARARAEQHLRAELARITTAERGLISELEHLGPDDTPAAQAYRQRIRARNAELYDERTRTETTPTPPQARTPFTI